MSALAKARAKLLAAIGSAHAPWGLAEANGAINNASRAVVAAMYKEHDVAWLGRVNRYGAERLEPVLWLWEPGTLVYNFGADFVLPRKDAEIIRLIEAREAAPYTGVRGDLAHVNAILDRIAAIGGVSLIWT